MLKERCSGVPSHSGESGLEFPSHPNSVEVGGDVGRDKVPVRHRFDYLGSKSHYMIRVSLLQTNKE